MKKFIPLLFFLALLLTPFVSTSAQAPPPNTTTQAGVTACADPMKFTDYSLCLSNPANRKGIIDTGVHWVSMTIFNVPPDSDGKFPYYYCLKSNPKDCDDDDLKSIPSVSSDGSVLFSQLCGDGASKLKLKANCSNTGSDYFHEGKTYRVTLYDKKKAKSGNIILDAAFYISHFYPTVVQPAKGPHPELNMNTLKNGGKLHVELKGRNQKDTGSESDKYNDYWLQVEGQDNAYKSLATCIKIPPGEGDVILKPTDSLGTPLTAGNYVLKIKDAKGDCEENEFSYYYIPFKIAEGGAVGAMGDPEQSWDPFGKEKGIQAAVPTIVPICPPEDRDPNGYCTSIATGLGIKIHTEPQLFVRDVFRIVLSLAGVIAILFFTRAGYTLMTSAGNKERVGGAREQITSAIMGIIFIILSITILEFIGIDILQIPGFTR